MDIVSFNEDEKALVVADFMEEFPGLRVSDVNFFLMLYDKFQPNSTDTHKIEGLVGKIITSIKEGTLTQHTYQNIFFFFFYFKANLLATAWDVDFWKVNDTFFETMHNYTDAMTIRKFRRLLTRELPASQLTTALKILKGIDPTSTPAENRDADVCFSIYFEIFFICFFFV